MHIAAVHEGKNLSNVKHVMLLLQEKINNLNTHIATVHEEMKPFKCDICKAEFRQKVNLNTHIAKVHEEMKPYVIYVTLNLQQNKI